MTTRWFTLLAVFFTILLLAPPASFTETETVDPNAVHWKDGDLMPPLPLDESARARALAQAEANALKRLASQPGVNFLGAATVAGQITPTPATGAAGAASRSTPSPDLETLRERVSASLRREGQPAPVIPQAGAASDRAIDLPLASPAGVVLTQTGIDDTGLFPASPDIAVGSNRVVIAVNSRFQVRDKCGTPLIDATLGSHFNIDPTISLYDPVTVYDEWSNRYLMAFIGYRNSPQLAYVYLAVSTDGTAQSWYYYPIPFAAAGNFGDDVALVVSPHGIYLAGNEFDHVTFAFEGTAIIELTKSVIYSALGATVYSRRGLTHAVDASLAVSARPVKMHSFPGAVYFAASKHFGGNTFTLWTLTGVPGSSSLASVNIPGTAYVPAPNMQQPNLSLMRAPDCRVADAVYDAGTVYLGCTTQHPSNMALAAIRITAVQVAAATSSGVFLAGPPNPMYPALDVDDYGRVGVAFSSVSTAEFVSGRYAILTVQTATVHEAGIAFSGQANYTAGSAPHRWGNDNGMTRDPSDDRTFWMHAAFASADPTPSWETALLAVGTFSNLVVTPPASLIAAGLEGGPFNPQIFSFILQNTSDGAVNWRIPTWPSWTNVPVTSGSVAPYSSQTVDVVVSGYANTFSNGYYPELLIIENCTGSGGWSNNLTLSVGVDFNCPGAAAYLFPLDVFPTLTETHLEPGTYVTAIEDIEVCAVGIYADIDIPDYVDVEIHEASGTTPGSLVWSGTVLLYNPEPAFHYIPLNYTLKACQEYIIALNFSGTWSYSAFDEALITEPFDTGGLIRVRNGAQSLNAGLAVLAPLFVIQSPQSCPNSSNLADLNTVSAGPGLTRGNIITANQTKRLCSVGIGVAAAAGTRLTASVTDVSGGLLLATGSAVVTSAGINEVFVPVSAVLIAGRDYNIDVAVPGSGVIGVDAVVSTPYTVDWFEVTSGSFFGFPDPTVTDMTLRWTEDDPGFPFVLSKPGPTSFNLNGPLTRGAYITSVIDQEVYSLAIRGDIPAGEKITAYVYRAVGNVRGPLLSTGIVTSQAAGERWHDVPLAASLQAGADFDLEVDVTDSNEIQVHDDTSGLPFTVQGTIQVRDGETGGNAAEVALPQLRVFTCNTTATPVTDRPGHTPMFLANPVPNPSSHEVRFGYAIDESGPAELAIYDVAGRLVDRVFQSAASATGGAEVRYDASRLASGVYFAKLTTKTKSLSRKFVVTH